MSEERQQHMRDFRRVRSRDTQHPPKRPQPVEVEFVFQRRRRDLVQKVVRHDACRRNGSQYGGVVAIQRQAPRLAVDQDRATINAQANLRL